MENIIGSFSALLLNIAIMICIIWFLKRKELFRYRYIGFGLIDYLIVHVIYSLVLTIFGKNINSHYRLMISIIILSIITVLEKIIMYRKYQPKGISDYISLGFGETINTLFCMIYPTLISNVVYSIKIADNSIYKTMIEQGYTQSQITSYVNLFGKNSTSYYVFTGIIAIVPLLMHIITALILKKPNRRNMSIGFALTAVCLTVYYLFPHFGYNVANISILLLLIATILLTNRQIRFWKKEEIYGITEEQ